MFWLRNWIYLTRSSSSSTLLLDILSFHSDVWQCLFCFLISCIQQIHWLIMLSNNILAAFFSTPKWKKSFQYKKKSYYVLSRCACAKLKTFLSAEKNYKMDSNLKVECGRYVHDIIIVISVWLCGYSKSWEKPICS